MYSEAADYLQLRRRRDRLQMELTEADKELKERGEQLLIEMDKTGTTDLPVADGEGSGKVFITETGVRYRDPTPEEVRRHLGDAAARSYIIEKVLGEPFRKEAPPDVVNEIAPKLKGTRVVQFREA